MTTFQITQLTEEHLPRLVYLMSKAYPGLKIITEKDREFRVELHRNMMRNADDVHYFGYFRDGELLGGYALFDFVMTLFDQPITVGGIGMVCVDLLHKKEQIAKEMLSHYLRHYRQQGVQIAALYPFRPDFYKKMGFGYGTKNNQYRIKPANLPKGPSKANIRELSKDNLNEITDCYHRYVEKTHGMMRRSQVSAENLFKMEQRNFIGVYQDGVLRGYLWYVFENIDPTHNTMRNNIIVEQMIYENPAALSEMLTFLHSQADQIETVVFSTQDDNFHYLLSDPRDGSDKLIPFISHQSNTAGVGLMYRVLDVKGLFETLSQRGHDFGGQTLRVLLTVHDTFLPENDGQITLDVQNGRVQVAANDGSHDVELRLDIADLSSLVMGAVDLKSLVRLGVASLSDEAHLSAVHKMFRVDQKPMCLTAF